MVDDAVLQSVENRRKHPSLSVMALLENEIESPVIYDPDMFERALTSRTDAAADEAVDLLLGTQGWRRFAYMNPNEFLEAKDEDQKKKDSRERIMAVTELRIVPRMRMFKNARAAPAMYVVRRVRISIDSLCLAITRISLESQECHSNIHWNPNTQHQHSKTQVHDGRTFDDGCSCE